MVKGEHLRPLLGFAVVCGFAVLILATGMTSPSALRKIVGEQRVLSSPSLTELVLGRTFDPVPQASAAPAAVDVGAAEQRTSSVLSSLGRSSAGTQVAHVVPQPAHHAPHPHKLPTKTTHGTTGTTGQAAAPAAAHQTSAPAPVTPPTSQPVPTPAAKPAAPVRNVSVAQADAPAAPERTRSGSGSGHSRHHSHDRGHSRGETQPPRGDQHSSHGSHGSSQTQAVQASSAPSPAGGGTQPGPGDHGEHGHGEPGQGEHGQGDHQHSDHQHGHHH